MASPTPEAVPPGVPVVPQGPVPAIGIPNSQDYPRLVAGLPYFEPVAIAEIIEPSVLEAVEGMLPTLVPPYVTDAANTAVNNLAVVKTGSTMTGPLNLSPLMPTADSMAATKAYVDTMVATGNVPEVPPVPAGQTWARQTGQWVPAAGGGTITGVNAGNGLTGGGTTGTVTVGIAAPVSIANGGTNAITAPGALSNLGGAPLANPNFTGAPTAPTAATADNSTRIATTAYVQAQNYLTIGGAAGSYAPIASPALTGNPTAPTPTAGDNDTSIATTAFVTGAIATAGAGYLPISGGTLTGLLQVNTSGTKRMLMNTGMVIGNTAPDPGQGSLILNANAAAPPAAPSGRNVQFDITGADASAAPTLLMDAFGGGVPVLSMRTGRGTAAAPTASQNTDNLAYFEATGRVSATAFSAAPTGVLNFVAGENFSATATGTFGQISATKRGTTTAAPVAIFDADFGMSGLGTTTNNNATAGWIGEVVRSQVPQASAITLSSGVNTNVTSISLTAGDWDVYGNVTFLPGGTTTISTSYTWINTVSASGPDSSLSHLTGSMPTGLAFSTTAPMQRLSLAATTTVYLGVYVGFGVSTMQCDGQLWARRAR